MPTKKEPFDLDTFLESSDPLTPLSLEERLQHQLVRPYLDVGYLASRIPDAKLHQDRISGPSTTFPCPLCGGEARVASGFSPEGPFKITCGPKCDSAKLRTALRVIAPVAFEVREDLLYAFPAETAAAVLEGVERRFIKGLDKMASAAVRRFVGSGGCVVSAEYKGPDGKTLMIVNRRKVGEKKNFLPMHLSVDPSNRRNVECSYPARPLPPFGWDQLISRADAKVLVVEGEETAKKAAQLLPDHVVVTSAMGSENAAFTDWSPLHNRDVVIWPDNDAAGSGYARSVAAHSFSVSASSVSIVALPAGLADKWDLADVMPDGMSVDDVRRLIAQAPHACWDDVKSALPIAIGPRHWPPFRLPDGHFSRNKVILKAITDALEHIDPGCKMQQWRGYLRSIHHALGDSGLEIADNWSKRENAIHGKYVPGEVKQLFEAFAAAPSPTPLPVLGLLRAAMKQSKANGGNKWEPEPIALALAQIGEFESRHRKIKQGDNVLIGVQKQNADGTYEIRFHSERSAESIYKSEKASNFNGHRVNIFTQWENYQLIPPLDLVFKPGVDVGPGEFNLFQGLDVQPAPGGHYTRFREHLEAVMAANGDTDGYLWKLLAYRLQNLDTYVPALLVLIGVEGSGKTRISNDIARLLSPYSVTLSDPEKFVGRNNAALEGKLFVQLEEMILGRKEDYDSRLKHYITSETLDVEEKYKVHWQIPNHLFVAMTANKREAVRVTEHSRRWAIYEVADRFHGDQAKRAEFFGGMVSELESGGYETLAYDLLRTDLTGFSPAKVPRTKLFEELVGVAADSDPLRGWWRERLESGILAEAENGRTDWSDPVRKDALYANYQGYCEGNGSKSKGAIVSKAEWAKQFGKMLPGGLEGRRQTHNGKREQFYIIPQYDECCAFFEKMFGVRLERAPDPGQSRAAM